MDYKLKIGLIGAMMLGMSMTGCVEDDQSVVMLGSIIGDGEIDTDDDTDDERVVCTFPSEMEDTPVRTDGFVDLAHLASEGQPLVSGSAVGASRDRYTFMAVFENRLFDSRSVGATSGGDGGGFEGLTLDKNDIFINSATVVFPSESNTFATEAGTVELPTLERERLSNMLVMSGGGISTLSVPLINGSQERGELENFLANINMSSEPVTFVVEIQLHGETLAGNSVSSNTIEFPLTVCGSCGDTTDALCVES